MITGGLEAAGDAITGAVIGRAVEPDHGERGSAAHGACLNCGAALTGPYCNQCGQVAHVHRTLAAYGHDLLHGVFHFEGKIWKTLPMLAFMPGELTRRYVHGERAKFVSPLALFLFAVFLMFAVFETVGGPDLGDPTRSKTEFNVQTGLTKAEDEISKLTRQRAELVAQGKNVAAVDAKLAEERINRNIVIQMQNMIEGKPSKLKADMDLNTGSKALDNAIQHAFENPKLLLYRLQSSAYKFAWALIPLSLPFMWLIFAWRRQFKIYDHAIFVTYSISSVILLLIVMALIGAIGINATPLLMLLPLHFFLQLKGAYSLTWFSASWRMITLLFVAAFVLIAFALLLLVLGLMG